MKLIVSHSIRAVISSLLVTAVVTTTPTVVNAGELLAQASNGSNSQLDQLLEQGRKLVESGSLDQAVQVYVEAAGIDPSNAMIFSGIAYVQALRGEYDQAVQFYRDALILDPQNPDFYYGLGYSLAMVENYAEAATAYRQAINLQQSNLDAHLGLAAALFRLQDYGIQLIIRIFSRSTWLRSYHFS